MGATVEFYSAEPGQLVAAYELEDFDEQFKALEAFPKADFSMHLYIFEDLDRLCQALNQFGLPVPTTWEELVVADLYEDDDPCPGSVQQLSEHLRSFGFVDDGTLDKIATAWAGPFDGTETALKALDELRTVCRHAKENQLQVLCYIYPY